MAKVRLTMAQALIKFIDNQYISLDNQEYKFVEGVWGIFGHGNVGGVAEALENTEHSLKFCQGHNEQGMVHSAIAYAKQKNRLGIWACTSSIGPGALNMVTAAATATTNRLPVLLLPGDNFATRQPDPVLQQLEQPYDYTLSVNDCFKPVSKYWDRVTRPEQIMSACINAFRVLTDPIDTGAVTICLPQDVQTESYDYPLEFFKKRIHKINRLLPSGDDLKLVTASIKQAEKPLFIIGGGVKYSNGFEYLDKFCKKHKFPIVETQAGKGVLLSEYNYNLGGLGVIGTQAANILAKESDCIIAVGTRLNDFTTCSKTVINKSTKIFNINISRYDAYKLNAEPILSDAKAFLSCLSEKLEQNNYELSDSYIDYYTSLKNNWLKELDAVVNKNYEYGLSQTAIINSLNSSISNLDIVVAAAGSLPGDMQRLWQVKDKNTYHLEYAFSCMGYEVAGALGAKIANPESEVYAMVGDGSFLMLHSELLTSLQENIKINIILFDNSGYQCIHNLQCSSGSKGFGNQFRYKNSESNKLDGENIPVDFAKIAEGLGVRSFKATNVKEFNQVLIEMKKSRVSTLVEIKVDPSSMSQGYDSWWRFDMAEVSNNKKVVEGNKKSKEKVQTAREF